MTDPLSTTYTSFDGHRQIASGSLTVVALAVRQAIHNGATRPILTFDDSTGRSIDIDTRGTETEVVARLTPTDSTNVSTEHIDGTDTDARGRGRPKLGVVPREVTLLPRHWEWLATQPGGASVALRKLVEEARRANADKDRIRNAQERAYRFISAIAGNLTEFEEASRALFANDQARFSEFAAEWPEDVRNYAIRLAFGKDDSK